MQGHPQLYNQPRTYEAVSKKTQNQRKKEREKKKRRQWEGRKEGKKELI